MPADFIDSDLFDVANHALKTANPWAKSAFVPADAAAGQAGGGDPAMAGGMPPGGDPAMAAMGGGDPAVAAGGGAPPPAGADPMMIQSMVQQAVQQAMAAGGGGGAGASGAAIKPKIDVNVELMQIKNMLAKICDALGLQIPAQDMVATPDKLQAMASGQPTTAPQSAIQPVEPVQPLQAAQPTAKQASSWSNPGEPYDTRNLRRTAQRVDTIRSLAAARAQK